MAHVFERSVHRLSDWPASAWRTVAFTPAPPGWRVVWLPAGERRSVTAVAGWAVQELDGRTRVVPMSGGIADNELREVDVDPASSAGWLILAPDMPDPDPAMELAERQHRYRRGDLQARMISEAREAAA
ncbi:hypothetical protein [Solwaraspora sp. WMMD792]|uniref:hypothetical protein n=1 Tax=Solwaraspora sp. WMMD792 TaxID=3016099 RepID=UPI002416F805|nr:hypothetical protein [Solwaraspora sp. WMMD792]MDG4770683.1 hypothetical protein [Solwaraspora sp. WMMD792]